MCYPELNPAERYFQELRAKLSNRIFETIEQIIDALSEALAPYWEEPAKLASLNGYGASRTCGHPPNKLG